MAPNRLFLGNQESYGRTIHILCSAEILAPVDLTEGKLIYVAKKDF
jgi:hypothetical protein